MGDIDTFESHRRFLFGLAYRLLGSVAEAEDIVQEAYLRWQRSTADVESPKSYLASTVTRLGLDRLRQLSRRREEYVGVWLPEPLLEAAHEPADAAEALADSLSNAFIVLLETLPPVERAVFLLHEVFAYDYAEIATMVDKTEANCRQMVSRARAKIAQRRSQPQPSPARSELLVQSFLQACHRGDVTGLMNLLTDDAVLRSDGGGLVRAATWPVFGADKISRFFAGIYKRFEGDWQVRFVRINATPSVLVYESGTLVQTMSFEFSDDERIENIYVVRNPEKLRHLPPTPDAIGNN